MIARYRDILREPTFLLDLFDDPRLQQTDVDLDDLMEPVIWPDLGQTDHAFRALTTSLLADFHVGERHASDFRETIEALHAADVEVVVVLLPVSTPYIDAHPDGAAGFEAFSAWLMAEVQSLDVPLFDYSTTIAEDEFLDYNHVTPDGAGQLTEMLASDLEGIGW